ncbi:unnamed protein product [Kluyveromyces dobzhanskii CBS 2104]|uniref:WGS project CCBQ000000000 data, contig 00107 n=1 Tax=Kluyveromyces dobzhanskii CBS 2104 TaxID=1427455 RepID=A0A0A8L1B6_9SACH|nr:unnamed protein product [Kluyveromyces dobzhanskii CBS 2104]
MQCIAPAVFLSAHHSTAQHSTSQTDGICNVFCTFCNADLGSGTQLTDWKSTEQGFVVYLDCDSNAEVLLGALAPSTRHIAISHVPLRAMLLEANGSSTSLPLPLPLFWSSET